MTELPPSLQYTPPPKKPPLRKHIFQVSEEAREHLYKLARRHGYAHNMGVNQRGISSLITALTDPSIIWKDSRDSDLKDIDAARIELGMLPIWYNPEYTRWKWSIRITDDTFNRLYDLALAWGITNFKHHSVATLEPGPAVSALLESIGQQCLVPSHIPQATPKKHAYRAKKSDWDWLSASWYVTKE